MKTSLLSKLTILSIIVLALAACKENKPHFVVEGKISNADTTMLYIERRNLNNTEIIDSVKLDKDGAFKFTPTSINYSEFYLLRLNGQTINLAIDSTETIRVNAPKETFALDYSIEGSKSSSAIKNVVMLQSKLSRSLSDLQKQFDSKTINQEQYITEAQTAVNSYKEEAKALIFSDLQSLASYFALFQKVDDFLIFDPYDKKDLRIFQALATIWDQYRSNSPRSEHLKNFTLSALAQIRKIDEQAENIKKLESAAITESSVYYNVSLPDKNNNAISLASLKGKAVILDFTMYQTDFSLAHNILLNNIYTKNKDKVEVYQVSFDADKHAWLNNVVNLPWICVRDEKSLGSDLIIKFNLNNFPATFLINKDGEIAKRLSPKDDLAKEIQKLL
ncbi:DUF4369 domain-containing protein [Dysgonomonas sp. Marseille-P4361]|uniref:DUF4369 domain-containing protein n=1 Tax=Dysgonomonas sp. Marseille-P4361 TaxID=2161820 RepID=UPI000D55CE13|nr:DUF4369 domain-containing protein [Dysgonomonas sp. Marseille-P4361]